MPADEFWKSIEAIQRRRIRLLEKLQQEGLAELIPRVALLDRPEHGFLEPFEHRAIGVPDRLEFLVQVIERLYRSLVRYLAEGPCNLRQYDPVCL